MADAFGPALIPSAYTSAVYATWSLASWGIPPQGRNRKASKITVNYLRVEVANAKLSQSIFKRLSRSKD
jgi:hypothetical protein